MRYLSGISMEIYLAHMVFFRVVEKLHIERIAFQPEWQYVLTCLLVIGSTIVFAHVMKYYVLVNVVRWMEK